MISIACALIAATAIAESPVAAHNRGQDSTSALLQQAAWLSLTTEVAAAEPNPDGVNLR